MERSWLVGASLLVVGCAGAREPPRADDDAGSADAAATVPSYPSGPTGIDRQGQIFPRLTFQGYVGGEGGPWATLDLGQLHDPTGTRGIHALVIVACAAWCPECGDVATKYPKFFSERYRPRGARFVYLLLEDKLAGSPATFTTATDWNARFHLPFDLGIDPARTTLPAGRPPDLSRRPSHDDHRAHLVQHRPHVRRRARPRHAPRLQRSPRRRRRRRRRVISPSP